MLINEIIETDAAKTKKDAEKILPYRIGRGISRLLKRDPDYDPYDQRDKEVKISTRTGSTYNPAPKSTQSSIYAPVDMEKIRAQLGARYGLTAGEVLHYSTVSKFKDDLGDLKQDDPDKYKKVIQFRKDYPPVFDRFGDLIKKEDNNMLITDIITENYSNWDHQESADYSKHLEKTFGAPDEMTDEQTVWHNKDGFKRIVCRDEYILHCCPAPHYDFVYSYIDLEVPENLSDELANCSGSILIDHLKNEVGARCGSLTANATTLNFVMDVTAGRTEPTKDEYEKRILGMKDMFDKGDKYELDWWPDESGDADPENPYYAEGLGEDLRDWFGKGKKGGAGGGGWDRYNTKGERIGKCGDRKPGEGKPKCLSKSRAASLRAKGGKKAIAAAVRKKRREDPNKNRRGKAKNVSNTTRKS